MKYRIMRVGHPTHPYLPLVYETKLTVDHGYHQQWSGFHAHTGFREHAERHDGIFVRNPDVWVFKTAEDAEAFIRDVNTDAAIRGREPVMVKEIEL